MTVLNVIRLTDEELGIVQMALRSWESQQNRSASEWEQVFHKEPSNKRAFELKQEALARRDAADKISRKLAGL